MAARRGLGQAEDLVGVHDGERLEGGAAAADLIEQQKLSRPGWTRSVEKMMRWGATISADEKEPLIEYLAARFGPR